MTVRPSLSIVIPVRDGAAMLELCLAALARSELTPLETIVVDDGSRDASSEVARRFGARVIRHEVSVGAAQARNAAVAAASGDVMVFIDADVLVAPDTLGVFAATFAADSGLAAAFGSYDRAPGHPGFISQYRNLLNHFMHQTAREQATIFFTGCGAMRREVLEQHGGFLPGHKLEDIELGWRVLRKGGRIRNVKSIQVKHLKRYTPRSVIATDVIYRGIPWTRMLLASGTFEDDLQIGQKQRVSVALAGLILLLVCLALLAQPASLVVPLGFAAVLCALDYNSSDATGMTAELTRAGLFGFLVVGLLALRNAPAFYLPIFIAMIGIVVANAPFYDFLARERSRAFATVSVAPHLVYFLSAGFAFVLGCLGHVMDRNRSRVI